MKLILLAGAIAASTAFSAYAAGTQLSQAECDSLWNQANPSGAATINQSQAQPYVTDFKSADPDNDGTLDQNEFSSACQKGLVKSASSSGAASGENSSKMPPSANKMAPAEKMAPSGKSKGY
jgi:hypothetical protein